MNVTARFGSSLFLFARRAPMAESAKPDHSDASSGKDVKAPNIFERAKEEVEAVFHANRSPHHHKETHGMSDDIDENTPVDEVKGPSVFERAKEEIEALVGVIHPKKDSDGHK
ncbi:hypothetical protein NL676_006648 [Syzygium grande]|nr:hypothetical protein NL676_006648 [Syzygium grande]